MSQEACGWAGSPMPTVHGAGLSWKLAPLPPSGASVAVLWEALWGWAMPAVHGARR